MCIPLINNPEVTICLPPLEKTYMGRAVNWIESMGKEDLVLSSAKQVVLAMTFLFLNLSIIGVPVFISAHREWLKLEQDRFYRNEFTQCRKTATDQFDTIQKAWINYHAQLSKEYSRLSENTRSLLIENQHPEIVNLRSFIDPTIESFIQAELPHMQFLKLKPRPYMGRFIIWIESWENHGFIFRITMKTLLTLGCTLVNASVIGIPLFIWGNREWTQRKLYRYYNNSFERAYNVANQQFVSAKSAWMKDLTEWAEKNAKQELMIQNLEKSKEEI